MTEPQREVRDILNTGDWLRWREHDITASRIAALFDKHPYLTRDELSGIMRGMAGGGSGAIPPDSPAMRRGRILEPAVAAAIAEDHPKWNIVKATTYHRLPECRLGCTPDYWLNDDGLAQIKTVSPQMWESWHGRAPLAYTLQTLTELLVTGRAWGVLAVMICNPSYPVYYWDIPRHASAEQRILDAVSAWWRAWDKGDIPGAAPSDALAADLDDGSFIDLSADNYLCTALPERERLKSEVSAAEKQIVQIDTALKAAMGTASSAYLPGYNISYKSQHRKEVVIPEKTFRVLRISTAGDTQ